MPTYFLRKNLRQTAVYWGSPAPDGYGGHTFADPIEIKVRWEEKTVLFIDAEGKENRSRAIVYVDRDVSLGGYLFLGTLDDLDSSQNPLTTNNTWEIRNFQKIPTLKGIAWYRKAIL